jgi:serine/threonine protein kinase
VEQVFARKIVHLTNDVSKANFESETRAVGILCKPGAHENIVAVLRHGYLNNQASGFFDMELCQLNLHDYIQSEWEPSLLQKMQHLTITKETKLEKAMTIMMQISEGVVYIHRNGEVHRDLKPSNGTLFEL